MTCIFCDIAMGKIPATIAYEDDRVLAFDDIQPHAEVHKLIIPRQHLAGLNDVNETHSALLGHMLYVASCLAKTLGIAERGYRVLSNCNEHGGQTVFHLHMHLLGGQQLNAQLA